MESNSVGGYSFGGSSRRNVQSSWDYNRGASYNSYNGSKPMAWHTRYQHPFSTGPLQSIHEESPGYTPDPTYRGPRHPPQPQPTLPIQNTPGYIHPLDSNSLIYNESNSSAKKGWYPTRRYSEDNERNDAKGKKKTKPEKQKDSKSLVKPGHSEGYYSAWGDPRDRVTLSRNGSRSQRRPELDVQSQVSFSSTERDRYSDTRKSNIASISGASVKDKVSTRLDGAESFITEKSKNNSTHANNLNTQSVVNKFDKKTTNISRAKTNDDLISSVLKASEQPGSAEARMKIIMLDGHELFEEIPGRHTARSRLKKLFSPITTFLIVLAMLGALGTALYFALEMKESQEQEIAILQAKLNIALAKDSQVRNFSHLSPSELEELKAAYCQQIDALYTRSNLREDYRGCEVQTLTNDRIQFKVFFVDTPTGSKEEDSIIQVLARESTSTGRQGEKIVKISDVKLDISEKSRSVQLETSIEEKDFYGSDSRKEMTPASPRQIQIQVPTIEARNEITIATAAPHEVTTMNSSQVMDRTILNANICSSIFPETVVAHPHVCSHYIQCDFNLPVLMPCPGGLVFDPARTACVKPTDDLPCTDIKPCENNMNGGHFPHPTNCHLFVICEQGVSRVMSCRNQLVWDEESSTCLPRKRGTECEVEG